jgi:hypothetical protein
MIYTTVLLLLQACLCSITLAQQDGWKMTDRFYGFRYEVEVQTGAEADVLVAAMTARATENKCFGWAQKITTKDSVVGEVRCMKKAGMIFKEWLEAYDASTKQILVYADTKIRLHFTYFKVLEEERNTCFLEPPHRCEALPESASSSTIDEL